MAAAILGGYVWAQSSEAITQQAYLKPSNTTPIDENWERGMFEEPVNFEVTPQCFGTVEVTLP